jgi:hypothetical protein
LVIGGILGSIAAQNTPKPPYTIPGLIIINRMKFRGYNIRLDLLF